MFSIYHFFKSLLDNKKELLNCQPLESFSYDSNLLSCRSLGKFPDMAIRLNPTGQPFTGGELIELKDSQSYSVSSFNSTIPTGKKNIADVLVGNNNSIRKQMQQRGDDVDSLPIRDVFYLIRGRRRDDVKVCLVHGSFFETVSADQLISSSFEQVLRERLEKTGDTLSEEVKEKLIEILSTQDSFSKVRDVDRASVKLRFRIMTEVKQQGNILNSRQYPDIKDSTINLILPCHNSNEEESILQKLNLVFREDELENLEQFKIKHHLNWTLPIQERRKGSKIRKALLEKS